MPRSQNPKYRRPLSVKAKKLALLTAENVGKPIDEQKTKAAIAREAGYKVNADGFSPTANYTLKHPAAVEIIKRAFKKAGITPALKAKTVAEAMKATDQRDFLNRDGDVVSGPARPDHRVRLMAVERANKMDGTEAAARGEEDGPGHISVTALVAIVNQERSKRGLEP